MITTLMTQFADLDLALQQSRTGGTLDYNELARQCHPAVLRFAASILNDPDDAEDAAQEALIAALAALDGYRGEASFRTWLYAITLNVCRKQMRKRKARGVLLNAIEAVTRGITGNHTPEEAAAQSEMQRELWAAVDALDEKHRIPIVLRYAHDLPIGEIAEVMGLNEGTVHSRLYYARESLQASLSQASRPRRRREVR
jgi:RNA polymerase sigma-70 factor (ECF subfamily)